MLVLAADTGGFGLRDIAEAVGQVDYADVRAGAFWLQRVSGTAFLLILVLMLVLVNVDFRHPRKNLRRLPFSVVIPCYNDGASIADTLESLFRCIPREDADVIVIDDGSRDDSAAIIAELAKVYPIRVVTNSPNKGKANSINSVVPLAKHDLILSLDADTLLNKHALSDMLARLEENPKLGAVSCPYRPRNRGVLPIFQHIDYNMFLLSQGACNCISVLGLWGGCLMTRKAAFESVQGFSPVAIADDFDYAFRLNRAKWRVSQSFVAVRTLVPDTIKSWTRQKLRWTSGGMQCYIRYFTTWIRNPIQVFFFLAYALYLGTTLPTFFADMDIAGGLDLAWNPDLSWPRNLLAVASSAGYDVVRRLVSVIFCCLPSFLYIIPMIQRWTDAWKFLLAIPFSLVYLPVYMVVNFVGLLIGVRSLLRPRTSDTQGWVN